MKDKKKIYMNSYSIIKSTTRTILVLEKFSNFRIFCYFITDPFTWRPMVIIMATGHTNNQKKMIIFLIINYCKYLYYNPLFYYYYYYILNVI